MSDKRANASRRHFLLGMGAAGAGAVAVAVTRRVPEAEPKAAEQTSSGAGYRLTEHVRRYYQTTRI